MPNQHRRIGYVGNEGPLGKLKRPLPTEAGLSFVPAFQALT
jgi:hypothetical protein